MEYVPSLIESLKSFLNSFKHLFEIIFGKALS